MFSQSSSNLLKKQQAREGAVQYTGLDEEQEIKFHEIVDLLLAGGYFRARISGNLANIFCNVLKFAGLSPFDKVVGGKLTVIDIFDALKECLGVLRVAMKILMLICFFRKSLLSDKGCKSTIFDNFFNINKASWEKILLEL
jgi:hypothetical protein